MSKNNGFNYSANILHCEKVNIEKLARSVGTPFYLYSYNTIINNFRHIQKVFAAIEPLIAFSVKSNSNKAILRALAREGAGFDVVSGGEIMRVLAAGGEPRKIVFAGVGKTDKEIELALKHKILMFNVESLDEAFLIDEIARVLGTTARISLRVNPDVDPNTHKYITTGKKENKFGVPWEQAPELAQEISTLKNVSLSGLHSHIGSQILDPTGHIMAAERLKTLVKTLRSQNVEIKYLNIGGGYGIAYRPEDKPFKMELLAARIIPLIKELGCKLILEPGRWIVGPAGAIVTRILYIKPGHNKNFIIVDAAMNDLIRPALYGAYHQIVPVCRRENSKKVINNADVVGPVCESGDFLGQGRTFKGINPGDLLCIFDAGAYGFVMSSQYNSRPRPPEILARNSKWFIVRERESIKDLINKERIPEFLK